jgi:S-adenosyl-L-methionine hydrolase (adenosine-forming)
VVKAAGSYFVGPDNGILTHVITRALEEAHFVARGVTSATATQIELGDAVSAVTIVNRRFWRTPVSPVFHARDIFAPVAAHLSLEVPFTDFGDPVKTLHALPIAGYQSLPDGTLVGRVISIDRFGNLITDIRDKEVAKGEVAVQIGKFTVNGLSRSYAEKEGLIALIGSHDYLEIAIQNASAQRHINASVGDEVRVRVTLPEPAPVVKPAPSSPPTPPIPNVSAN